MMKRLVSLVMVALLLSCSMAYATDLGSIFGGLTSMFGFGEETTYGVGEPAETDGVTITLVDVFESKGSNYYTPAKGNEYLIFEFSVKNGSKEELALSTLLSFSLNCDGTLYSISFEALSSAMLSGKVQLDTVIKPGKNFKGVVGYEVPLNWKEARVEFTKDAFFGETIVFKVEK